MSDQRPRSLTMTMTPRTRKLPFVLAASIVLLAAAAWFVLPALRMAKVTLVAHGDPKRASVQGLVQTAEGVPLAGAKVTWFAASDHGGGFTMGFVGGDLTTRTAADGTFRFDAVPAAEGFAELGDALCGFEGRSRHVLAQNGMRAEGLRLTAEAIEPTRWLRGQLRRPDGSALPFAQVQIRANGWLRTWQGNTSTDAEGRFAILGPWSGAQVELLLLPFEGEPRPLGTHTLGNEVALVVGSDR